MKTVSIVVPIYNQARYIAATLDHILQQDYPALELILCDDASTDGTREILSKYLDNLKTEKVSYASHWTGDTLERVAHLRYPQDRIIKLVLHPENMGATRNYNSGFRMVTGEYATFIVGDDLPQPSMISSLVEALEQRNADFAYSDMWIVDDTMRILRPFHLPEYDFKRSFCDWYLCGNSKLFRSSLLKKVGYFDERYKTSMDYDLFARFAMSGARFVHVPKVLYSLRFHGADRKIGLHSPANEQRTIDESAEIAGRCREFLGNNLSVHHRRPGSMSSNRKDSSTCAPSSSDNA